MITRHLYLTVLTLCALLLGGCLGGGERPEITINQYTLSYEPICLPAGSLDDIIRVERFTSAREFNVLEMIYQPRPFTRHPHYYQRWRAYPADLVTDSLIRDLRQCSLFTAVMSYQNPGPVHYSLEGSVEEFFEENLGENSRAVLTLNLTLLDLQHQESGRRLVYQKTYRTTAPLTERNPLALAAAMSSALQEASRQIMADMRQTLTEH